MKGFSSSTLRKIVVLIVIAGVIVSGVAYLAINSSHATGRVLNVNSNVSGIHMTKIVSLDPAATATLYALGAFKYLVGGNCFDTYPPNENLTNVTDYPTMSIQQIVNLSPDAVISFTNYSQSQVSQLTSIGINYIFLSSGTGTSMSLIENQTTFLGMLTGTVQNATLINTWMNESLDAFSSVSVSNEYTMFYALYPGSHGTWTAGNNTFMNQIFSYSHLINIADIQSGFYEISNEVIVSSNPQYLVLDQYFNDSLINGQPYINTTAYKTGHILNIFDDNIFQEPNFRAIFAIEWLMEKIYNTTVQIPPFPIALQYNPEPVQVQ